MTEEQLNDLRIYFPLHKLTRGTIVPETMWEYFYGEGFAITTEAESNHGQLVQLGELCNEGYNTIEQTANGWMWLGECYEGTATLVRHPYNPDVYSIEAPKKG
jgi:hypothetical protein